MKTELGLRPVYHQKTDRVTGHLFITVLAYHLVHTIRYRLKSTDINSSWGDLRKQLEGQARVTITMKQKDGNIVHVRKILIPSIWQSQADIKQFWLYNLNETSCADLYAVNTSNI